MKQRLNIDNPFFNFMGKLGDLMLVNILFLIYSIPIVTIGPSLAAMYQCFSDMRADAFQSALHNFHQAFRKNRRQALPAGLVMLASGLLLAFNLSFLARAGVRGIWGFVGTVTGCLLLLWEMAFAYLFPVAARQKSRLSEKLSHSLYLAVLNLPYTLPMVLMNLVLPVCIALGDFFTGLALPLYMVFGFALIAWADTALLARCKGISYIGKE